MTNRSLQNTEYLAGPEQTGKKKKKVLDNKQKTIKGYKVKNYMELVIN